jgi:hypothetical protein
MPPEETILQMASRHVVEGKKRIARQEILIARLARGGHIALAHEAEKVLDELLRFQWRFEKDLEQELVREETSRYLPGDDQPVMPHRR